jgi:TLD
VGGKWYGNGEAFLWRLKKPRYTSPLNSRKPNFEREMEVYPYTGYDDLVQYCTTKTIAVGGGDWTDIPCPFDNDTQGIGFMIDGDLAGGETNSCSTFANPRLAKQTTASSEFSITNLEVWTLTPCLNVSDAARMEMQLLFLDEQGTSMIRG